MAEIFRSAVEVIGANYYNAEQLRVWGGPRVTAARLDANYSDGRETFVAVDEDDQAIAFTDLESDGHVDMLYCDPAFARQGVATALLSAIERAALKHRLKRLHTEASEAALRVFEKAGFKLLHRRDLHIDGVAIHNWAMEKQLKPQGI